MHKIIVLLKNPPRSFENTKSIETDLLDLQKFVLTVLKIHFQRVTPKDSVTPLQIT